MNKRGTFVMSSIVLFVFVLSSQGVGAAALKDLSRSARAQIEATESALSALTVDVPRTSSMLEQSVRDARTLADNWEQIAAHESDDKIKAAVFRLRDGELSDASELTKIGELLRETGQLGDDLESNEKLLASLQDSVEGIVEGSNGAKPAPTELNDMSESLTLMRRLIASSRPRLVYLMQTALARASLLTEYDKKNRALLAGLGNPQDRIKHLEKDSVEIELACDETKLRFLEMIGGYGVRVAKILQGMGATLKIQQDIVTSLQ